MLILYIPKKKSIKIKFLDNDIKILIDLALSKSSIDLTYNNFCNLFEKALECVFDKKDFIDTYSKNESTYLLKSVLLSCAYSIYTKQEISNL